MRRPVRQAFTLWVCLLVIALWGGLTSQFLDHNIGPAIFCYVLAAIFLYLVIYTWKRRNEC
jgi:uncharacterized membrane protein YfcA